MMKRISAILTIVTLTISGLLIIFWAPTDSAMGIVQKIMYIHVPSVWLTFLAFFVTFIYSIRYLWKRDEYFDMVAYSTAEIGVLFCGLGLITGSIWGKPTWNTYWTWDARLTTFLILFLIFVGYLLLRKYVHYGEKQARLAAIVAIIGTLDIPLIHQSVTWWRTLHQPSTMFSTKKSMIDISMQTTLWISVLGFTFLFIFLTLSRVELEKKTRMYFKKIASLHG